MFKIEGTKSQGCCYCDKCKLVNNNHTSEIISKNKENKAEQFKDKYYKKITQIPETNEVHIFNQNTGKIIKKKVTN